MQTPKSRNVTVEVPPRTSPISRTARQLKTPGSESDSASSTFSASRTPKDRSPKIVERRSPRSPVSEKKRPNRVVELESELAQVQEELKKAKERLHSSESWKKRAQQEAEEAKKQLSEMAAKLDNSQRQLLDLAASEEARVQELRKISQERDRAWQSELEAVQKHNSVDSGALATAMNEIHRLKVQLEMTVESEVAHAKDAEMAHDELQALKRDMCETLSVVESMKIQLKDSKESEEKVKSMYNEILRQLETAKATVEMLQPDGSKSTESFGAVAAELEDSRARVNSLQELVSKLQTDLVKDNGSTSSDPVGESVQLIAELNSAKSEVNQLRSALEAAEIKYHEEQIRSTTKIQCAYEAAERTESIANLRKSELEAELKKTEADIIELKANLMDKETELQSIVEENEGLSIEIEKIRSNRRNSELDLELKKSKAVITDMKTNLTDKERELLRLSDENKLLKSEIENRDMERGIEGAEAEALRISEREALVRLGYVTEEADKSNRRAARVTEQLEATQAVNKEMEAELRRLRVQTDQWRKAAEAAAALLSSTTGNNNGKSMERSGSFDAEYNNHITDRRTMSSPYSEDVDDEESPKKKNNNNMLKKIGVLWKKGGQK